LATMTERERIAIAEEATSLPILVHGLRQS
jgi:hypothetical protein